MLTIGLLAWAIVLWQRGAATTGDVILTCTLGLTILHATRDLAVALVDATQHVARLAEALPALLVPHDLRDHPEATALVENGARLSFERVSFRYPDGHRVFSNFNLEVEPGQRVGLLGQSGSGKSTLFALLQRFYDVQGGRILIDGQDIAKITQDSLRKAIAVVPQDVSLFHRSVMENIRYGKPEATDDMVLAAALAARCDFIEKLPDGFDTVVGARGVKLSGGQRQRIAIARAFLKDAPLLLLDEATSSLDIEFGGSDPRGARQADAGTNRDRDRAPAVDGPRLRPHRRAAGRTGDRGWIAGQPDAARRALSPAHQSELGRLRQTAA